MVVFASTVEKYGYNCVDRAVNKLEDSVVENALVQENIQENEWGYLWAKYLMQSVVFSTENKKQQAQQLILAVLDAIQNGDSCLPTTSTQAQGLRSLVAFAEKNHLAPFVFEDNLLYLYRYYALEQRLAMQVSRLTQQTPQNVDRTAYQTLLEDEFQRQALNMVCEQGLNIITGGPGTGKTYTLARIIAALHHAQPNLKIAMAAPTGKAAQRMQEALQLAFLDSNLKVYVTPTLQMLTPMTLHRLLGMGHQGVAKFNVKQPLPYDVVVVDEASMLDLNLATLLFEALPDNARLILLGDANQLASVDVGAVLADLQVVLKAHHVNLKNSRRFSDDAQIGCMAKFIQQADHQTQLKEFEQQVVAPTELKPIVLEYLEKDAVQLEYLPQHIKQAEPYLQKLWYGFKAYSQAILGYLKQEHSYELVLKAFDEYRILTAMRHGMFGIQQLNRYMEQQLLQETVLYSQKMGDWYVGRPVMMTENDYQIGLSNGDIGICFWHRIEPQQYEVYFPSLDKWISATRLPRHIQTAFALTIHKSQGSEFTHTAVVLDEQAQQLLSQELLYTAITRAKKVVSLLAHPQALQTALCVKTTRKSGLIRKIKSKQVSSNLNTKM